MSTHQINNPRLRTLANLVGYILLIGIIGLHIQCTQSPPKVTPYWIAELNSPELRPCQLTPIADTETGECGVSGCTVLVSRQLCQYLNGEQISLIHDLSQDNQSVTEAELSQHRQQHVTKLPVCPAIEPCRKPENHEQRGQ